MIEVWQAGEAVIDQAQRKYNETAVLIHLQPNQVVLGVVSIKI